MRCRAVLSLLLAAGAAFVSLPAAAAAPMCSRITFEGGHRLPDYESGQTCVAGWPYGQDCEFGYTWYGDINLTYDICTPAII